MYKFITKNGRKIDILKAMKHMAAHSDVDMGIVDEALRKVNFIGDFFIEAIDMGRVIGKTSCVEVKPGDNVEYYYRKNREGMTPFIKGRESKDTTKVTICLKKVKTGKPILITAFYGDRAPMEPWDARRKGCSDEEIKKCEEFWSSHALVYDESVIDFERS